MSEPTTRDNGAPLPGSGPLLPDEADPKSPARRAMRQAMILLDAAAQSPMPMYAGSLRGEGDELRRAAIAFDQAEKDGIDGAELVSAGALRAGVRLYWPNRGPGKVIRCANQYTGIYVEWDIEPPEWVNVLGAASPVVVIP